VRIGDLEVVAAREADLGAVVSILVEASKWLTARSINQWPLDQLLAKSTVSWISERCRDGEVFLVQEGPEVAATFTLVPRLTFRDHRLWGDRDDDAVYLHGLAVRRRFGGREIGRRIIGFCEKMGFDLGKSFIRLDCWKRNPALVSYYSGLGFTAIGECESGIPGYEAVLFEKALPVS